MTNNINDIPYLNITYGILSDTKHTKNWKRPGYPGTLPDIINLYSTLEEGYTQGYWQALTSNETIVQGINYPAGTPISNILQNITVGSSDNIYTANGTLESVRTISLNENSLSFAGTLGSVSILDEGGIAVFTADVSFTSVSSLTKHHLRLNDGIDSIDIFTESGSPESVFTADTGSLSLSSSTGDLYIKETNNTNTGWAKLSKFPADDIESNTALEISGTNNLRWAYGNPIDSDTNAMSNKHISFVSPNFLEIRNVFNTVTQSSFKLSGGIADLSVIKSGQLISELMWDSFNGMTNPSAGIKVEYVVSNSTSHRYMQRSVDIAGNITGPKLLHNNRKVIIHEEVFGVPIDAQTGNAILDVKSSSKGILLPRLTTAQINAISSPEEGLTLYNTTLNTLCYYNGTEWRQLTNTTM